MQATTSINKYLFTIIINILFKYWNTIKRLAFAQAETELNIAEMN